MSLANDVQIRLIGVLLADTEAFPGWLWVTPHKAWQAHASDFCPCPGERHPGSSEPRGTAEPQPCEAAPARPQQPTAPVMGSSPPGAQRLSSPQQTVRTQPEKH